MAKKRITIYVESHTYDRIQKNKRIREQVLPPGWTKIASYAAQGHYHHCMLYQVTTAIRICSKFVREKMSTEAKT